MLAVEPTLAGDGELAPLADWGAKYVGAVARIACILHLAEHGADKGRRETVAAQTIRAASRIGTYFKAAAINAFIEMGTDQGTADAQYLLERVRCHGHDEMSERDLHVASPRVQDKSGSAARAGTARRARLPPPVARTRVDRRPPRITALQGAPGVHKSHTTHRRQAMTDFCALCVFCVLEPQEGTAA